MRAQNRKQPVNENQSSKFEIANVQQAEDSEATVKLQHKKNPVFSDGLPMHTTVEQLKAFLIEPANSVADRAVLLDARDRLVRLVKDAKDKNIGTHRVTTLRGTCLDMCPEKERYSRAEKHRLALYEMLVSPEKGEYDVDHRLAVKEYSRSSADQAEPLAHELRPLPVLQMTMDYLIAKIVDRCNKPGENLGDWYNFLWDRMRGIRKDITQQSLCEQGSVDLVEKCARFHIHCTSRLCELDMQDFDQKINDENLTKCLQTLKHMYYDLSVKNIYCPNEAEFRSYDVLLHLNDGEILREVLQLRYEIRDSYEVRSALEFVNTLNSRNYVRFFKLVRLNRDYLQCCLLQRYFNQMRNQALQIMVAAYGPPKKGQMQLFSLVNLLGYEDVEEAAIWCEFHGLPIDPLKNTVKFERPCFIELPEKFPPMRRSSLIENKRISSVSKCIAKSLMPEDPTLHHIPLNSFDSYGVLLPEAWLAEDQGEFVRASLLPVPSTITAPTYATVSQNMIETISVRVRNELILVTVNEILEEIVQQLVAQQIKVKTTHRIFRQLLEEFTRDFCTELVSEVVSDIQTVKYELQYKLDLERKVRVLSSKIFADILDCVICEQVKYVGMEEIQSANRLRVSTMKEKHARRMLDSLVSEIVTVESRAVASVVAYEAIEKRENMVSRVLDLVNELRIRRWIRKWRRFTASQIRRRKEKQTFPACPSRLVFDQQIASLKSKGESPGVSLKRKSLVEQTISVKRCNSLSDLQFNLNKINSSLEEKIFDLFLLLERSPWNCLAKERNRCWKLVIMSLDNEKVGEIFRKWFGFSTAKRTRNGWVYTETKTNQNPITLCVRFAYGADQISEFLRGANAFLVVYDPFSEVENTLHNLAELISMNSKYFPLSVALIASKDHSQKMDHVLQILKPCCHKTLSFDKPCIDKYYKLADVFSTLFQVWQTTVISPSTRLSTTTVWDLANNFISNKVLPTIYRDMQLRLEYNLPHQPLSQLLDFNNHAVQCFLENIVLDSELSEVQWPASEFVDIPNLTLPPTNWNSFAYQNDIKQSLERYLILPFWQPSDHSFSSLCVSLRDYCVDLFVQTDVTALLSRVDSILFQAKQHFEKNRLNKNHPLTSHIIPWTDIFQACIDYRLQALTNEGSIKLMGYFPQAFDEIQSNSSWVKARSFLEPTDQLCLELCAQPFDHEQIPVSVSQQAKSLDLPESIATLCNAIADTSRQSRKENTFFESILLHVLTPEKKSVKCSPVKQLSATPISIEDHLDLLERRLQQSRSENKQFESYLKRALNDA